MIYSDDGSLELLIAQNGLDLAPQLQATVRSSTHCGYIIHMLPTGELDCDLRRKFVRN